MIHDIYIYIYIYMYIYIYTHIYIYRKREREGSINTKNNRIIVFKKYAINFKHAMEVFKL